MKIRKFFGTVMAAALTSALCLSAGFTANAASFTNEGLTAEIISDNGYYAAGETANVIIKLTNHNDFAVSDISMDAIIPEGLEIVDDTATGVITPGLDAGETLKLNVKVKAIQEESEPEQSSQPSEVSEDSQPEDSQPSQEDSQPSQEDSQPSQEDSQPSQEDSQPSQTENSDTSKTDGDNETSKPAQTTGTGTGTADTNNENGNGSSNTEASAPFTGDATNAAAAVIMIAGAAGVIYVCLKKKKATKVLSLVLCTVLASAAVSQMSALAVDESLTMNSFSVSETLCFNKTTYSLSVMVKYHKIVSDDDVTYTRGEWIKLLAAETGLDTDDVDPAAVRWFYGDTKNTEDGVLYECAYRYGIIPAPDNNGYEDPEQDIALFEADKLVTREYAAYSAVKALGFVDTANELTCADAEAITYPAQVTTALKFNMLSLLEGKFEPNQKLTQADRNQIVAVIRAFNESVVADEDEVAYHISYADGVVADQLADVTDYTATLNPDDTYTVMLPANDVTKAFTEGTIFVLPANGSFPDGACFKAVSVSEQNDMVTAVCTVPSIEEVAFSVYMKDNITPSIADFVPAEGVTVEIVDSSDSSGDDAPIDMAHDFDFDNVSIKASAELFEGKGEVSATFSIPRVSVAYRSHIDWDWFNTRYVVDEALFAITKKLNLEGSITLGEITADGADEDDDDGGVEIYRMPAETKEKLLGKVPISLPYGFKIDVKVYLYAKISGELSIGYVIEDTSGLQVINDSVRLIQEKHSYLDKVELAGTAEAGLKPSVTVGWTIIDDLIGVQIKVGIGLKASLNMHFDINLYCIDVTPYFALSLGVSTETAVGKVISSLGLSAEWEIFNDDNAAMANLHIENLRMVEECTYGNGAIEIVVTDSNHQPINQCQIIVKDSDGEEVANEFLNNNSRLTVPNVEAGQVTVQIKATGYKVFNSRELISPRATTHMDAVLMILRQDDERDPVDPDDPDGSHVAGHNTVRGSVTDALTGSSIDASYVVRKGRNASADAEVLKVGTTDVGSYSLSLPYGYYTITFSKDGYIDSSVNVIVRAESATKANVAISPELNDDNIDLSANMRIVLTWGATPKDLDSHLLSTLNSSYHTYYNNKNHHEDGVLVANLDLDDTTSYGPETTTIYKLVGSEKFSYYVHDFTNRGSSSSTAMSNSGARVVVYSGSTAVAAYSVPIGYTGNLWHVFDYDPITKTITPVNSMSNISTSEFKGYFINRY